MKKLMIAAAIVCAAAFSQAATFSWISANKCYLDNSDPKSWTDGQVLTALTSGTQGYMDATKYNVLTWTYEMTLTDGTLTDKNLKGDVAFSTHKISKTLSSEVFSLPTDDSSKTYTWDIVIKGTGKIDGKDVTLTSNTIHDSAVFGKNSSDKITFAAPETWTVSVSAVPEPTSGLLLLLGVAGLALRRRRA